MSSVAIRIPEEAHTKLRDAARSEKKTIGNVILELFADREEHEFWERARASVARVRENQESWDAMQAEQRVYDGALLDGLEK